MLEHISSIIFFTLLAEVAGVDLRQALTNVWNRDAFSSTCQIAGVITMTVLIAYASYYRKDHPFIDYVSTDPKTELERELCQQGTAHRRHDGRWLPQRVTAPDGLGG